MRFIEIIPIENGVKKSAQEIRSYWNNPEPNLT